MMCKRRSIFNVVGVVAALSAAVLLVGCTEKPDDEKGGNIVNRENEAWINCGMFASLTGIERVTCSGSSFPSNGDKIGVYKIDGEWYGCLEGTYTLSGSNTLTMTLVTGQRASGTYRVSGNTLTMDGYNFERTSVTWTPTTMENLQRMLGLRKLPVPGLSSWRVED